MEEKTNMFEIATIEAMTDVAIYTGDYLDELTEEIRAAVKAHKPDMSTAATRKKTISFAAKIAKARKRADDAGKDLNEERRKVNDKVNERRRQLRDDLDGMRDEVRKPVTDYEAAEEAKEEAERQKVLDELDRIERERVAAIEKREAELAAKEEALRLAEVERLAAIAAEQEKKDRLEREATIAAEATVKAEREAQEAVERAEREKQEAIDNAERDRLKSIEDAKQAEKEVAAAMARQELLLRQDAERKVQAERDRIAAEKLAEDKAAELREADTKHKAKINNDAVSAMVLILSDIHCGNQKEAEALAKSVVVAIARGHIPHVSISY